MLTRCSHNRVCSPEAVGAGGWQCWIKEANQSVHTKYLPGVLHILQTALSLKIPPLALDNISQNSELDFFLSEN